LSSHRTREAYEQHDGNGRDELGARQMIAMAERASVLVEFRMSVNRSRAAPGHSSPGADQRLLSRVDRQWLWCQRRWVWSRRGSVSPGDGDGWGDV